MGKSGGNQAAQSEAICRLISLALRTGVDPQSIVKQLKGITGANPVWHNAKLIRSTPDAIGQALERYLAERASKQAELPLTPTVKSESSPEKSTEQEKTAGINPSRKWSMCWRAGG
jgi:ribonucleoside-diphosphate reductase alpha chain